MSTPLIDTIADKVTTWVGSTASLVFHTVFFVFCIATHWVFGFDYNTIFLVLTTAVSLEAIYISIFIQRAVNQQGVRLENVEDSIDDVEEALDDVEEALDEDDDDDEKIVAEMRKLLKEFKTTIKDSIK